MWAPYIYWIASGERTPTWEVTKPEDLMFLWNRAHALEAPPVRSYKEAIHTLQAALRGLYLAASSPGLARLPPNRVLGHLGSRPRHTAGGYLRWPVARDLTVALHGDTKTIRAVESKSSPKPPIPATTKAGRPGLPPASANPLRRLRYLSQNILGDPCRPTRSPPTAPARTRPPVHPPLGE
ncbi:hypothetical protein Stsp01_66710 [Streptomyces sp. NBRC 13847]|nr:hypothetical protein Stsp01_66710 [Streptomyces sp. NBRC 13847]